MVQGAEEIYSALEGLLENWRELELDQPLAVVGHEMVCKSIMLEGQSSHSCYLRVRVKWRHDDKVLTKCYRTNQRKQ